MACPRCGNTAPALQGVCGVCGSPLAPDAPLSAIDSTPVPPSPPPDEATRFAGSTQSIPGAGPLMPGQTFGSRYHIIKLLGVGGMGAVYQAWDQTLEVAVALKVILHETTNIEAVQDRERRFKRELLLARQVTHKNVVRIHDLGEIDGTTYITMPYVQGSNLATMLKRDGRLPVDRTLSIAREMASGLAAAHAAGVVHRDLKPANIMVDAEGGVLIMDFGIARSTSGATGLGITAGDAIVGTLEYMPPEQAQGAAVDERADIYSFGLILNDMLVGRRQSDGAAGLAELLARMQRAPTSLRSIDPAIPVAVDGIVTKCLQPDPASRYHSVAELLVDLESLDSTGHHTLAAANAPTLHPTRTSSVALRPITVRLWIAGVCLLPALAVAGWALRDRFVPARAQHQSNAASPTISLAILPFRNASGDPALDSLGSSMGEVLRADLGQSSRVRTVPSDRLHQVLLDLRLAPNATLAPTELARLADFTSARTVLSGQFTRFGQAIRIDATLQDLDRGQTVPLNATAPNESGLLAAMSQLAQAVRESLGRTSPDILNELKATSWKPSTGSFEALRHYSDGRELTRQGKHQEARKSFEAAEKADGNFALALSALAQSYATLGYDTQALQRSQRAVGLSDSLPPQEKYLIAANHYRIVNDTPKAIEAYENLVKASPNSAMTQFDLGGLYEQRGAFDQARQHFAKVVELDPKFIEGLLALGRVDIRRGNPADSLDHLNAALTLAIQLDNDEARANIQQAIGIAYKRLNRSQEALKHYTESLEIKRRLHNKRGVAASLGEIAQIQEVLGKLPEAEQSYKEALEVQREIGNTSGIASSLVNLASLLNESLGRPDDALPLLREALQLGRDAGNLSGEALALNNIGSAYLSKRQYAEAQTYFERALELREKIKAPEELADTLHNIGETLAGMGRDDQSLTQYLRALDLRRKSGNQRGAAIESYSIGSVFERQGRYGAAAKSQAEALATFRELKQRDMWLGEILGGYGRSLSLSGRFDDAGKSLDEALELGRELQNRELISRVIRSQAYRLYYMGDVTGASQLTEHVLQSDSRGMNRLDSLSAQADVATMAAALRPTRALASRFAALAQEADRRGSRESSVDYVIQRAEILLRLGDYPNARQEAERALAKSETLGRRMLLARAHYVRAAALRLVGDASARGEYLSARRLLDEVRGEEGNHDVLKRADLAPIYAECLRWSTAP